MAGCGEKQVLFDDDCKTPTGNVLNVADGSMDRSSLEKESHSHKSPKTNDRKRVYAFDDLDDGTPVSKMKLRKFISSASRLQVFQEENNEAVKRTASQKVKESCECDTDVNTENVTSSKSNVQSSANTNTNSCSDGDKSENRVKNLDSNDHTSIESQQAQQNEGDKGDFAQRSEEKSQQEQGSQLVLDASHRVLYVYSAQLIEYCNQLPRIPDRADMVHSLVEALGLLQFLTIVPPIQATDEDVAKFHPWEYIDFLQRINQCDDEDMVDPEDAEQYGLTYDCPVQKGVYDCAKLVAGATITAAEALCKEHCHIAINWCGGWHHAQRSEASGFCYINDIVLGILKLREKFSRVLYVDLDLHHGDGVENAFSTTPHVMTVSFHKFGTGFFPGTGHIQDTGLRRGRYYSVNVPFKDGICDADFYSVFKRVMSEVRTTYDPEVVVCQCGADGLAGDPMSAFNLTLTGYRHCLYFLMLWKLPLLLLGGGGYHHANTARCWASLTALAVGRKLPQDVPDHGHFPDYGPGYELTIEAGNRKNCNTTRELLNTCKIITKNLQNVRDTKP